MGEDQRAYHGDSTKATCFSSELCLEETESSEHLISKTMKKCCLEGSHQQA